MARLEKFLEHGINSKGIPYEGFYYWGLCLRTIGLFGLLVQRDADLQERYTTLRARFSERLDRSLDWLEAATFPNGSYLVSYNHSPYSPHMAVHGLLIFFGDSHPEQSLRAWSRLVGDLGNKSFGATENVRDSSVFEARFFLPGPGAKADRPALRPIVDDTDGWALLQSPEDLGTNKLFVKSSRHLSGPHNQSDANHFTAFLAGNPVFVDAGEAHKTRDDGTVADSGSYRREGSSASSFGHNAIIIDGKGQAPSGNGRGVSGRILHCSRTHAGTRILSTSASSAYNVRGYNPVAHALRHFVFRTGPAPFLFVFDDIEAQDGLEHTFDRLLQLPEVTEVSQSGARRDLRLRFDRTEYGMQLTSGAVADSLMDVSFRSAVAPWNPMTTMRDTVLARNPYFWFMATPVASACTITALQTGDHWAFDPGCDGFPFRIRITKAREGQSGAVELVPGDG